MAITFHDWLEETIANEEADEEHDEDLARYAAANRRFRNNAMIDALAVFFPDMPELEWRVLAGVTNY